MVLRLLPALYRRRDDAGIDGVLRTVERSPVQLVERSTRRQKRIWWALATTDKGVLRCTFPISTIARASRCGAASSPRPRGTSLKCHRRDGFGFSLGFSLNLRSRRSSD
jgi:hypothetical protein